MNIRLGNTSDIELLKGYEKHIDINRLKEKLETSTILMAFEEERFVGWLRYNYFWDEHPFMNMLFVLDEYRGKGYGAALVEYWETLAQEQGHDMVMLSTMANESSQHFYRGLGYSDIGGFMLDNEPMEIMMVKELQK